MSRPLFLLGLGGFGKWVVTAFKTQILDTYGKKPDGVEWLSVDLISVEDPRPRYKRFHSGRLIQESLDFNTTSEEFVHLSGDFTNEIQKIKTGKIDPRFEGRMSKEDAELIISALEKGVPAAERRHASMLQFVLDIDNIKKALRSKLDNDAMVFVVSSWAGGTGSGILCDCLLLLRNLMKPLGGTIISIILLPQGFEKVKENEDMGPLHGNCYATFREFLRLFFPKGNVKVQYSMNDLDLQNISKPSGMDVISDVVYIIDGTIVGGEKGNQVAYYRGTVPSIVNFINNSFLATAHEEAEVKAGGKNATSFDQGKTHATANFTNEKAKSNPLNALTFASFGSYRLIFDSRAVKTEFAQRIAIEIFGHKHFLSPSWIHNGEFAVKEYMVNTDESTKFDKEIVHDCITKGHQISNFATLRSLSNRLEEGIKFPDPDFGGINLKGKVKDTKRAIDNKENIIKGNETDQYKTHVRATFYAVYNYYLSYYPKKFEECIQNKVLRILNNQKDTDNYGKGSLKAAESFIGSMEDWYVKFLRGFPEKGEEALFALACEIADAIEGTPANWQNKVDQFYKDNKNKGKIIADPRKTYIELRVKLNELETRELVRKLIRAIAEKNLISLETLHIKIKEWISTFEDCQQTIRNGLDELLEVRSDRIDIACDEYLTNSEDKIENRLFELITNYNDWEKIKNATENTNLDQLEIGLKEIIHKIPHRQWADFLKGFSWEFNLPDENGKLLTDKHLPGELICLVDAAMPDFPAKDKKEQHESVRTWNYKLIEYYLTEHKLNELERISAFEILMLRQDNPENVLDELKRKSALMLFYNDTKEKELINEGYASHQPENHFFILGDFGCQANQPILGEWLSSFKDKMYTPTKKESITIADEKDRRGEVVFLTSKFCLPAPAMVNLINSRQEYYKRLEKNLPPPLHIFKGEKEAFKYETSIAKIFRTGIEELHPQVLTILEDEIFVRNILWANLLNIIWKEEDVLTGVKRYYFLLTDKEVLSEGKDWPLFCDLMYDLIYTTEENERKAKNIIEDLNEEVKNKLKDMSRNDIIRLKNEKAEEYKNIVKNEDLPKREKDIYKIWTVILSE